jgi:hypothetical protein
MQFYAIYKKDNIFGKIFLYRQYEAPYRYSSYTYGDGSFDSSFMSLKYILGDEDRCLTIFENKKEAEKAAEMWEANIINLNDIEEEEENNV